MAEIVTKRKKIIGSAASKSKSASKSNAKATIDECCLGTPKEIARDNAEWEQAFASTSDEQYDALIESIRASIRTHGTTPLDFNRK